MNHLEIEVKFYLSDISAIRYCIIELGAENRGQVFETNIRFEDDGKNLIRNKSLLRLRKDTKTTLTYKSEPRSKDNQYKIFRELEVEVSHFSTMKRILESLGFREEQRYEKRRETFILKDTLLCLDSMPYGDFLEIEGSKEQIKKLALQIGMRWEKRIVLNYLAIFDIIRKKTNVPYSKITFDNFKNINVNMNQYLHLIEVGSYE
ncbi:MAG: class IV adenylate cyclase [Desulfobacterales bacterium]|nr:MAG: class IV adenylate cyclase [Desulfobacterales bacterium]